MADFSSFRESFERANIIKKYFITAAVLPLLAISLAGCSASGITQVAQMVDKVRKVQKTGATVEQVTG